MSDLTPTDKRAMRRRYKEDIKQLEQERDRIDHAIEALRTVDRMLAEHRTDSAASDEAQQRRASRPRPNSRGKTRQPAEETCKRVLDYLRGHSVATAKDMQEAGVGSQSTITTHINTGLLRGKVLVPEEKLGHVGINTPIRHKPVAVRPGEAIGK